jgi:hypothetical protein
MIGLIVCEEEEIVEEEEEVSLKICIEAQMERIAVKRGSGGPMRVTKAAQGAMEVEARVVKKTRAAAAPAPARVWRWPRM